MMVSVTVFGTLFVHFSCLELYLFNHFFDLLICWFLFLPKIFMELGPRLNIAAKRSPCEVQLLLRAKADPDLEGPDEQTPLFQAANQGRSWPWNQFFQGLSHQNWGC